ncbi:MAG: histidinol-phosphate aminotransferase family protein [Opitutales bacterium]|nr:histidinol-phosphate aminotransferase family protein [Opitutales bacterium]NRA28282.1 histidinol-phosphate aminotransferase family protein [Opitutales bacterium]
MPTQDRPYLSRRRWLQLSTGVIGSAAVLGKSRVHAALVSKPESSHPFINLSINENQFGPSPKVREAMIRSMDFPHEYPDEPRDRLTKAIARAHGLRPENVLIGAGSADILYGAGYFFGLQGGEIISSDPSFHILSHMAEKVGATLNFARFNAHHAVDLDALKSKLSDKTRMVYICNPENPTGTLLKPEELKAFCKEVSKICPIVIDEAYIDYAGDAQALSMIPLVAKDHPVVITRTFSKGFGLGGMRVGYAVSTPELVKGIGSQYVTGIGCGASRISIEAAIAAFGDTNHIQQVYTQNKTARTRVEHMLTNFGLNPIPSKGGFVLAPVIQDSKALADGLFYGSQVKISPRNYFGQNYLRISVGRDDQLDVLEAGLKLVLG